MEAAILVLLTGILRAAVVRRAAWKALVAPRRARASIERNIMVRPAVKGGVGVGGGGGGDDGGGRRRVAASGGGVLFAWCGVFKGVGRGKFNKSVWPRHRYGLWLPLNKLTS